VTLAKQTEAEQFFRQPVDVVLVASLAPADRDDHDDDFPPLDAIDDAVPLTNGANAAEPRQLAEQGLALLLGRLGELSVGKAIRHPQSATVSLVSLGGRAMEVGIVLEGLDLAKETTRIQKRLGELAVHLTQIESKLSNPDFVSKAPSEVLEKNREKLHAFQAEQEKLSSELARLRGIAGGGK